jgi:integrase
MAVPKVNLRKVKRKNGTTYFIDFTVNGKRFREAIGSNRKDAEVVQAVRQSELVYGTFQINRAKQSISLKQLIDDFLISKKNTIRKGSYNSYNNLLNKFLVFFNEYFSPVTHDIKAIKTSYIKECFDFYLGGDKTKNEGTKVKKWSRKTTNNLRTVLIQLFHYATEHKYITENPVNPIKEFAISKKKIAHCFTDEQLDKIWFTVNQYWADPLKFIVNTGLRKGEMINLKWKNVVLNAEHPYITVISTEDWDTKTGEYRTIPLNKEALEIINKWKGRHPEYVFIAQEGHIIHPDKPYRAFKKALKKLNLEGDVHKLRHTFASKLLMKGETMYTVGKLLGHSEEKTTELYGHLSQGHLKSAVDKLNRK